MTVTAIVPAAGESRRFGGDRRKPFSELAGEPVIIHACRRLRALPGVSEIILAVHPEDLEAVQGEWWPRLAEAGATLAVAGGASRAESVWNAVAVGDPEAELLAIHDAARPLFSRELGAQLLTTARRRGAAIPALPATDTVKRVETDRVTETLRRGGLMLVQTPQVFRRDLYLAAGEYALRTGGFGPQLTDDASLLEAHGQEVAVVMGEPWNLKLTTRRDLALAEAFLKSGLVPLEAEAASTPARPAHAPHPYHDDPADDGGNW